MSSDSSPIDRLLAKLEGVKPAGSGKWMALCPAHEDRQRSLSIRVGADGRAVMFCHARCETAAIVAAIGLTMADLFAAAPVATAANGNGAVAQAQGVATRPRIVKSYDYYAADGTLVFQSCRFEPKAFRQRRRGGNGEWVWNLGDVAPVLYRLPGTVEAVAAERRIFVVEGEKDADALVELGYPATTNPMGAGKWRESYSKVLAGADVVILPDNDDAGRSHAEQVAASLHAAGCRVRMVTLPNLPPKGDVSDWLAAGGDLDQLETLIGRTSRWTPDGVNAARRTRWRLDELWENDSIMRPPPPIVPRLAWSGRSTLLAAREKSGKALPIAAPVLTSTGWTPIGALRVGDALASIDGAPSRVTGVYPQGQLAVWRVVFSDGAVTECSADHLWTVRVAGRRDAVLSTSEIAAFLGSNRRNKHLAVPLVSGHFGSASGPLPIDPYLLGALLGDGSLTGGSIAFSKRDPVVVARVRDALSPSDEIVPAGARVPGAWRIRSRQPSARGSATMRALAMLGLRGTRSHDKFIPAVYLGAAREQRVELLRGLLDTDGGTMGNGAIEYATVSPTLARDVGALVRSLGGLVTTRARPVPRGGNHQPYRLTIRAGTWILPLLTLARHASGLPRATRRNPQRTIVRVERTGALAEMVCIRVDHPSATFITEDYVVTHNSTLIGYIAAQVSRGGIFLGDSCASGDVLIIGLEEFLGDAARRLRHFDAAATRVHLVDGFLGDPRERPQELAAHIDAVDPMLVVIDSLAAYSHGQVQDDNNASQMTSVVQPLTDLAHARGVALIVAAHARKQDGRSRGSTAITAGVDVVVEFFCPDETADPTLRRMRTAGRVPVQPFYDVRFDGDRYVLETSPDIPVEAQILSVVGDRPGCSINDVCEAVTGRRDAARNAIARMLANRTLINLSDSTSRAKLALAERQGPGLAL